MFSITTAFKQTQTCILTFLNFSTTFAQCVRLFDFEGDKYTVISPPDKEGSVLENGNFSKQREGVPGCWMLDVQEDATVKRTLVPSTGMLADLLKISTGSVSDGSIDAIRVLNPGTVVIEKSTTTGSM